MKGGIRKNAIKALECTAVVAVGIAVGPNNASADTDDDASVAEESHAVQADVDREGRKLRSLDRRDRAGRLSAEAFDVLSGLDRTYVLCLAATSPVDKLRLAAARALAFPLYAVGERTALLHLLTDPVDEVREEAIRSATLRGTWSDQEAART